MPRSKNKQTADFTPLVIGTASSALFDLSRDDEIFRTKGLAAYEKRQKAKEKEKLKPGYGFPLIKKLLKINDQICEEHKRKQPVIEVILLSRNTANTGLRVFNSIEKHRLNITKVGFCGGKSPHRYARDFGCHLFLSRNAKDVKEFIDNGLAAATLQDLSSLGEHSDNSNVHIAFDGDAVLFSNESERVNQEEGLSRFTEMEKEKANVPLNPGPFAPFLERLSYIQREFYTERDLQKGLCPIRTALVTARSAPAHKRVILTLRKWKVHLDESLFLGSLEKGEFLKSFGADIFFDDQWKHLTSATKQGVASGHVPNHPHKRDKNGKRDKKSL